MSKKKKRKMSNSKAKVNQPNNKGYWQDTVFFDALVGKGASHERYNKFVKDKGRNGNKPSVSVKVKGTQGGRYAGYKVTFGAFYDNDVGGPRLLDAKFGLNITNNVGDFNAKLPILLQPGSKTHRVCKFLEDGRLGIAAPLMAGSVGRGDFVVAYSDKKKNGEDKTPQIKIKITIPPSTPDPTQTSNRKYMDSYERAVNSQTRVWKMELGENGNIDRKRAPKRLTGEYLRETYGRVWPEDKDKRVPSMRIVAFTSFTNAWAYSGKTGIGNYTQDLFVVEVNGDNDASPFADFQNMMNHQEEARQVREVPPEIQQILDNDDDDDDDDDILPVSIPTIKTAAVDKTPAKKRKRDEDTYGGGGSYGGDQSGGYGAPSPKKKRKTKK